MQEHKPMPGYEPPKAVDDPLASTKRPRTVGYLIGAIVQLVVGGLWTYQGVRGQASSVVLILGLLVLGLGVRAVIKYRAERTGAPKGPP